MGTFRALRTAPRAYRELLSAIANIDYKSAVVAATTSALPACGYVAGVLTATLVGAFTAQDGVTLTVGQRLLVKNQVSGLQNGIYTLTNAGGIATQWVLTRATDADSNGELAFGSFVTVESGTTLADSGWILATRDVVVGTTAVVFTKFFGAGAIQTEITGDAEGVGRGTVDVTIPNDTVTYAKMQNVSATDKILGRSTAGAGDVEEIACTAAGRALIDDANAAAQRTTLGLGTLAPLNAAPAGTLTGTTLAANVVASSLTSVGILALLTLEVLADDPAVPVDGMVWRTAAGLRAKIGSDVGTFTFTPDA